MTTFLIIAKMFVWLLTIVGLQSITRGIMGSLNEKIAHSMKDILDFVLNENKKGGTYKIEEIEKETNSFFLIQHKKIRLGFITRIVGYFEIVLFSVFTYVLVCLSEEFLPILNFLAVAVSGWLAIKIFGSYQQWSGAIFGRATFYVFLIGSLMNIIGAIAITIVFSDALFR